MPHTPGHWYVIGRTVFSDEDGAVCHMERSNPNTKANARLITAAPQMLRALQTARDGWNDNQDDYDEILAAISSAMGIQS